MKVTKRADGRYCVAVSLGRGKRKFVYGATADEAKRKAVATMSAHYEGKTIATAKGSVGAFLDRWIAHLKNEGRLRPRTLAGYEQYVELYLKPGLGSIALAKLTAADVAEFLAARKSRPRDGRKGRTCEKLSPLTMRHCHAILRRALKQAMRWELIAKNPASADYVDAPRVQRKEARYLGADEARKLLGVLKADRLGALFLTMIATGLRPSEAYGLTWARVDLENAVLHVREGLEFEKVPVAGKADAKAGTPRRTKRWYLGELKTAKSRRDLPLPAPAVTALREHRLAQNREKMLHRTEWVTAPLPDLVFTTRGGQPLDDAHVRRTFRDLLDKAGLEHATPYALRHSWASLALLQGVPLRVVAEGLGHTGVALAATTYAHVAPELQRQAADLVGKVLSED